MLSIYVYSTYFAFKHDIHQTQTIGKFNISYFVNKYLADYNFDPYSKRFKPGYQYAAYYKDIQEIRMPRQLLNTFLNVLRDHNISFNIVKVPSYEPQPLNIKMNPIFQDREGQTKHIDYLTNCNKVMCSCALNTGKGKSYIAIRTLINLNYHTFIRCTSLLDQWYHKLLEYTNLQPTDIEIISGIKSIENIWNRINNHDLPKIVLASIQTLMNYIDQKELYLDFPPINVMFEKLGIGTQITDETHLNFKANVRMDLAVNTLINIYLTATFMRTNQSENKIFKRIYPDHLYISNTSYDKYTNVIFYKYALGVKTRYPNFRLYTGYSHSKYEKYISDNLILFNSFMHEVLIPLIDQHFIKIKQSTQRCIIFADTILFCTKICSILRIVYPNLNINTKLSKDPEENYLSDIIISTFGSSGTGSDIPNLKTVFNTISFCSEVTCTQTFGRLRQLPNDTTYFIDLYNGSISDAIRHKNIRKKIYEKLALSVSDIDINC
jgi:hypothetical protein